MSRFKKTKKIQTAQEKFEYFVRRVEHLFSLNYAHRGTSLQLHIVGEEGQPLKTSIEGADEEEFRSYLLSFRQFIASGEPTHIGAMYTLATRHFAEPIRRDTMIDAQDKWKKLQQKSFMEININGQSLRPIDIVDKYIAYYFHSDDIENHDFIDGLQSPTKEMLRYQLLTYVDEASRHINYLADNIFTVLQNETLSPLPLLIGTNTKQATQPASDSSPEPS